MEIAIFILRDEINRVKFVFKLYLLFTGSEIDISKFHIDMFITQTDVDVEFKY